MSVRIVQLGSPRQPGEGLRIGTVRRPPRGVPKDRYAKDGYYDVWLPELSPSAELLKAAHADGWNAIAKKFRSELKRPEPSRLLDLFAALSHSSDFSVGCYCEDEAQCHRSVLREALAERGAKFA